jgi:hypothetical protein
LVQDHIKPGCDEAVVDGSEPRRPFRMMVTHVVQLTVMVRDVRDRHLNVSLKYSWILPLSLLQCNIYAVN